MTNVQYKFLKLLYRHDVVTRDDISKHFPDYKMNQELNEFSFQRLFSHNGDSFFLTVEGKAAFEVRRRDNFRFTFPVLISLLALALSVLSIVLQYA